MSAFSQVQLLFKRLPFFLALRMALLYFLRKVLMRDAYLSFSQMGEDRIIANLFPEQYTGFYVEVGSNEPIHFSNTFGLYCKGWRGITIDANPGLVAKHKSMRLHDTPMYAAISNVEEEVTFVEYDMHELNTIDQRTVEALQKEEVRVIGERRIKTQTLTSILQDKLPGSQRIDVLYIDVEGHDFEVLQSLDLSLYRPWLIVIEMHNFRLEDFATNGIYQYLTARGYVFNGYAVWNGFFVDSASRK
ncbi:FkbM family methyltransferase [Tellurirhabdus bombi]|uniref:FkbM family methyltransferase n=1 Tax=Tellurirhabdus bombi TaxID=2907205 RepID=UPI001F2103BF|nr:FkbM family methyltransferase [Tellurirhabdus bombi]